MAARRFCPDLWVFRPFGPVVRDKRLLEPVHKSPRLAAPTRSRNARCFPRQSHWLRAGSSYPHVSMRNAGVNKCANEVNRTFRSSLAFFVIWLSCVDIVLPPLHVLVMFP